LNSGQQDKRVTGEARHPPGAFLEPLSAQLASRYLATVRAVAQKTRQRLPRQAAELMGREELAIRLKVPAPLLDAWMRGLAAMPDRKLILLADALENFAAEKKK
jgi:hypothetical protein